MSKALGMVKIPLKISTSICRFKNHSSRMDHFMILDHERMKKTLKTKMHQKVYRWMKKLIVRFERTV